MYYNSMKLKEMHNEIIIGGALNQKMLLQI